MDTSLSRHRAYAKYKRTGGRGDKLATPEMNKATRQYLARYAEPEADDAARLDLPGDHAAAVVLPAAGEGSLVLRALEAVPDRRKCLVVVVVNEAGPGFQRRLLSFLRCMFPARSWSESKATQNRECRSASRKDAIGRLHQQNEAK